jgi:hypothetical protein
MSESLKITGPTQLPVIVIQDAVTAEIERLLGVPALMAKCTTQAENKSVFESRRDIESLSRTLERERKKITDPVNDWLRKVKAVVDTAKEPLDREAGRLAALEKDFNLAEDRRIREEQEAQQRELDRIERERQAEVARLAREQAERESAVRRQQEEAARIAREAQEAADRATREATNKKQRGSAAEAQRLADAQVEAARIDRERQDAMLATDRALSEQAITTALETADAAASIASKPIERTRETGQTARRVWKITSIDVWKLVAARPDLVHEIIPSKLKITEALNRGEKIAGVVAEEDYSMGARGGRKSSLIEA